uniref:Uncharacterized protein n=1 Tax=Rhizophora mucronata TaxID=61149 RepID=A0A2P2P5F8_RHIMU
MPNVLSWTVATVITPFKVEI